MLSDLFSFGSLGIWESLRPPMWPLILGFFWKLPKKSLLDDAPLTVKHKSKNKYLTVEPELQKEMEEQFRKYLPGVYQKMIERKQ